MNDFLAKELMDVKFQLRQVTGKLNELELDSKKKEEELAEVKKELEEMKEKELENTKIGQTDKLMAYLAMVNLAKSIADTLPDYGCTPQHGHLRLPHGIKYVPGLEALILFGAAHGNDLELCRGNGFTGYPSDFFDNIIKYYYETEKPEAMLRYLYIRMPYNCPAPWPSLLLQPHGLELGLVSEEQVKAKGVPTLKEEEVSQQYKIAKYTLANKQNPKLIFKLDCLFENDTKCYKHMTEFRASRQYG